MVEEAEGDELNLKADPSPDCKTWSTGAVEEAENRVLPWLPDTVRVEMVALEEESVPLVTVLLVIVVFVVESPTIRVSSIVAFSPPKYLKSPAVPAPYFAS